MKKRLIGIQSLRGILGFFIVMHHIINYFGYTTGLGYAGVSLFIIMSGFLEAYNHLNQAQQFGGGGIA